MAKYPNNEKEVKQMMDMLKSPNTDFSVLHHKFEDSVKQLNKGKILEIVSETMDGFVMGAVKQINDKNLIESLDKLSIGIDEMLKYDSTKKDKHSNKLLDKAATDTKKSYDSINSNIRNLFDNFETFINYVLLNFEEFVTFNKGVKELYDNNILTHEEYHTLKLLNKIRNIIAHNENIKINTIINLYTEVALIKAIVLSSKDIFNNLFIKLDARIKLINYIFFIKYNFKNYVSGYMYIEGFDKNKVLEEKYNFNTMSIPDMFDIMDKVDKETIAEELKTFRHFIKFANLFLEKNPNNIPEVLKELIVYNPDINLYEDYDKIYGIMISSKAVIALQTGESIKDVRLKKEFVKIINYKKEEK